MEVDCHECDEPAEEWCYSCQVWSCENHLFQHGRCDAEGWPDPATIGEAVADG
jgi:hypothetical protein